MARRRYASKGKRRGRKFKRRFSRKKRVMYKGKRKSASFTKAIAAVMNPPLHFRKEVFNSHNLPANRKLYIDMGYFTRAGSGRIGSNFCDPTQLKDIGGLLLNQSVTDMTNADSFWVLKATRYYEVTNITNVPMYCKLHKIYLKQDSTHKGLLDVIYTSLAGQIAALSSIHQRVTADGTPALTAMSASDFMDPIEAPYIYASPADTLSGSNFIMDKFEVLNSLFTQSVVRKAVKNRIKVKSSKEFQLMPQQQVTFSLKKKKPYLFNPIEHIIETTQSGGSTGGTGTIASSWKGLSCAVVLEVVGMTGVADETINGALNSAPGIPSVGGNLCWSYVDNVKVAKRTAGIPRFVKDTSSWSALAMDNVGSYSTRVATSVVTGGVGPLSSTVSGQVFGAANNTAQAAFNSL